MAIAVDREMLRGSYRWKVREYRHSKGRGRDLILFSRKQGHEVLAMVQMLCNHFEYFLVEQVWAAENVILTALPGRMRSRRRVLCWLIEYLDRD